jgi:hypothetical protein
MAAPTGARDGESKVELGLDSQPIRWKDFAYETRHHLNRLCHSYPIRRTQARGLGTQASMHASPRRLRHPMRFTLYAELYAADARNVYSPIRPIRNKRLVR